MRAKRELNNEDSMEEKKSIVRVTFDFSMQLHKTLKIKAASDNKSMREIVIEAIEEKLQRSDNSRPIKR